MAIIFKLDAKYVHFSFSAKRKEFKYSENPNMLNDKHEIKRDLKIVYTVE